MSLSPRYDMHQRRASRNIGVGLVLAAFVALVFGLTVVKLTRTGPVEGYDHVVQPHMVPESNAE